MLKRLMNRLRPALSEGDRRAIASLKSMKTFQVVNGTLYVEYEDVQKEMLELHQRTKSLFPR